MNVSLIPESLSMLTLMVSSHLFSRPIIIKFHTTETALIKIHNDMVVSVDEGHVGALALLA